MIDRLNWPWIALMCTVPLPLAAAVASLLWRRTEPILGNLAGTIVIFSAALGFILRESVVLNRLTRECLDAGETCWPHPSAFSRYAIYAAIGLLGVIALFLLGLPVDRRMLRRHCPPEGRRRRARGASGAAIPPRRFSSALQGRLVRTTYPVARRRFIPCVPDI